jgi:mycofactocin precursor
MPTDSTLAPEDITEDLTAATSADVVQVEELLVEEVSIDGMCGVY